LFLPALIVSCSFLRFQFFSRDVTEGNLRRTAVVDLNGFWIASISSARSCCLLDRSHPVSLKLPSLSDCNRLLLAYHHEVCEILGIIIASYGGGWQVTFGNSGNLNCLDFASASFCALASSARPELSDPARASRMHGERFSLPS